MRSVVQIDHKIDKDKALALLDEFGAFFKKHTGIDCEWYVERRDFSQVPTVPDSDGDLKPTREYRKMVEDEVYSRYGEYGTDNIIMWVHEDNFLFRGIWGSNWSYNYHSYSLQLCRWDKKNKANTFGTLYHELMHSFDTLVRQENGGDALNDLIEPDWDAMVHGGGKWKYIGRRTGKENSEALKIAGPHIAKAFSRRKEAHLAPVRSIMWQVIHILRDILRRRRV